MSGCDPSDPLKKLAAVQQQRQALDRGEALEQEAAASPGVRRIVAARSLAETIQRSHEEEMGRGLAALQARSAELVASAQLRQEQEAERCRIEAERRAGRAGLPVMWPPVAVLGFRVWEVGKTEVTGARLRWEVPSLSAVCLHWAPEMFDDDEVPHTTGCGSPPCGIYAFTAAERLVQAVGLPRGGGRWGYGVVELTGKVVEHEHGYRARHARVVAMVVVEGRKVTRVEGDDPLRTLFAAPEATLAALTMEQPELVSRLAKGPAARTR